MSAYTVPLISLARIIRSKNAGPFRVTFDVLFETDALFEQVRRSGAMSRANLAKAFGVAEDRISSLFFVPTGKAMKVTLLRPIDQCDLGESDVYGCQQHVPLMTLPVPVE